MKPTYLRRNADLIFVTPDYPSYAELDRLRQQIKEQFSGHRAMILCGGMTVTQIKRPIGLPYRPSMVSHGGKS